MVLRNEPHLSFLLRFPTKDITKNLPLGEGLKLLQGWLASGAFRNAHLFTPSEEVQLAFSKKGKATVRIGKLSGGAADAAGAADVTADVTLTGVAGSYLIGGPAEARSISCLLGA